MEGCDGIGGRIFADQLNVSGSHGGIGVLVDGVDSADVQFRCLQGGHGLADWVKVMGGPDRQKGRRTTGQVSIFTGATGTADHPYVVEKAGHLVVRGVYHEMSGESPEGVRLADTGKLLIDSTRFSYKTANDRPMFCLDGFKGSFALLTGLLLPVDSTNTASILMTGDDRFANVLCLGNVFWVNEMGVDADKVWRNTGRLSAGGGMLLCNMNSGVKGAAQMPGGADGFAYLDARGNTNASFVVATLSPLREARVWVPGDTAPDLTDLRIHRVIISVAEGGVGAEFRARSDAQK